MSVRQTGRRETRTPGGSGLGSPRAFTLIETLVVVSIITLLLTILMPALGAARDAAKTVVCASKMKTLTMEFGFFAEGMSVNGRGDSEGLGGNRFRLNDFQDSVYQLDEFWELGSVSTGVLTADRTSSMCPAGASSLTKRRGLPCGREAVGPVEDVSIAMNMRLYRAVFNVRGKKLLASPNMTVVSPRTMSHPYAPLVMDVDGRAAAQRGVDPFYIAPPIAGQDDPYANGRYWSPAQRHGGKTLVGFVGGHVLSSVHPESEHWDWGHQAEVGR